MSSSAASSSAPSFTFPPFPSWSTSPPTSSSSSSTSAPRETGCPTSTAAAGLSDGAAAGIIVGVCLGLLLFAALVLGICCYVARVRKAHRLAARIPTTTPDGDVVVEMWERVHVHELREGPVLRQSAGVPGVVTVMGVPLEMSEEQVTAPSVALAALHGEAVLGQEVEGATNPLTLYGDSAYVARRQNANPESNATMGVGAWGSSRSTPTATVTPI